MRSKQLKWWRNLSLTYLFISTMATGPGRVEDSGARSWLSRSPRFLLASCPIAFASNKGCPPAIHAILKPFTTPDNSGDSPRNWWNEIQDHMYCLTSTSPLNAEINRLSSSPSEFCWFGRGRDDPLGSCVKSKIVVSTNFTASNLTPSFSCCYLSPQNSKVSNFARWLPLPGVGI
jgi:hypothetical protein